MHLYTKNLLQTKKLNVAEMRISLFDRVENTLGKGENAGYQHFLLFPQCFPKPSSLGSLKSRDCLVKGEGDDMHSILGHGKVLLTVSIILWFVLKMLPALDFEKKNM